MIQCRFVLVVLAFIIPLLLSADPIPGGQKSGETGNDTGVKKIGMDEKASVLNGLAKEILDQSPDRAIAYAKRGLQRARLDNDRKEEAEALLILGKAYFAKYQCRESTEFINQALTLQEELGNTEKIGEIHHLLGQAYVKLNFFAEAEKNYRKALDIAVKTGKRAVEAEIEFNLGELFYSSSNYDESMKHYNVALAIEKSLQNTSRVGLVLNKIGIQYHELGNFEKALEFYTRSLEIVRKAGDKKGMARSLNNIGIVYSDWGNKQKALEYYEQSLRIEEELGNRLGIADSYNNIGIIFAEQKNDTEAIKYYERALKIYREFDNMTGEAMILNNIGECYFDMGEHQKALSSLTRSLEIESEYGTKTNIATYYQSIGKVYFQMGDYQKALAYNDRSFALADSLHLLPTLAANYELYSQVYEKQGDYKRAFSSLKNFSVINDTLFSKEFYRLLANLQARYELEKADREKEALVQKNLSTQKELLYQRISILAIFFFMLVFGILVYHDIRSKKRANKKLQEQNLKITEQKDKLEKTFEELQRSEEKYRNLVKNSPTGILYLDTEGQILELNHKILDILGSPGEEATKAINCMKFEPLIKVGFVRDLNDCIEKGQLITNETLYVSKWGKVIDLLYYLTPIRDKGNRVYRVIANIEDITARKLAENALKESEEKYRILVENSLQAMFIIQDGKLLFANKRMEELTQYTFDELADHGTDWMKKLVHPEDLPGIQDLLFGTEGSKTQQTRNETRFIRKDGRIRWIQMLGSQVDYRGKVANLVVAVDITPHKDAEKVLRNSEKKLREANATKDKFFSIIAHDLKNPFNAIIGFSNLLYESYDTFTEKQKKSFIKNICDASESTYKLLQNLLDWSRTQTGKIEFNPEVIDLSLITSENIAMLKSAADNKEIGLHSDVPFNTLVFADENMIKTVVRNLLSNAIKFTTRGGAIYIKAKEQKGYVEVSVADTGIGISPENQKKLFSIDEQLKTPGTENEKGTGLGLILCKEFIEKNKGCLSLESVPGQGSVFRFTLPKSHS
jgi:PAS domain S-box-containing protein